MDVVITGFGCNLTSVAWERDLITQPLLESLKQEELEGSD